MIGLGKWACNVNTMFFSGEVKIDVFDNNGEYGFEIDIPGIDVPDIEIRKVEEDGDSIYAVVRTTLLPGKDIELNIDLTAMNLTVSSKSPSSARLSSKTATE